MPAPSRSASSGSRISGKQNSGSVRQVLTTTNQGATSGGVGPLSDSSEGGIIPSFWKEEVNFVAGMMYATLQ